MGTEKLLLRKPIESFDTGIMKMLRKFQYWAEKNVTKQTCIDTSSAKSLTLKCSKYTTFPLHEGMPGKLSVVLLGVHHSNTRPSLFLHHNQGRI